MSKRTIVIVGASLAGISAAESLREHGFEGRITLVGDEAGVPYDRPPLSKQVLQGAWLPERTTLRAPEHLRDLDLDLRLGRPASHLDVDAQRLFVGSEQIGYDACLLAVGVRARTLPGLAPMRGLHVLRTLEDATRLRDVLRPSSSLVVVGAGFVGLEVAASARLLGVQVTVVESLPVPLARALGEDLGARVADLHRSHGVEIMCDVGVAGVDGGEQVEQVRLTDGQSIAADNVVVGIGGAPNVEWLRSSPLVLDDGVVCDEFCRTSAPNVYAAGDVARWRHPVFGTHVRIEHWTNAVEQGRAAAINMLTPAGHSGTPYRHVPYFWSDQYDTKIQFAGRRCDGDTMHIREDAARGRLLGLVGHEGKLTGVVTFNWPSQLAAYRQQVLDGVSWSDAVGLAEAR